MTFLLSDSVPPHRRAGRTTARELFDTMLLSSDPCRVESFSRVPECKLKAVSPTLKKKKPSEHLRSVWPLLQELVRPRRKLLALGFLLMVINRVCGMVLPASSKILFDNILGPKHQVALLEPLVLAVLLATIIQGVTS